MKRSAMIPVAIGAILLLVAPSCRKAEDKAAEKLTEKIIEAQSGGKADVDLSGGSVKVTTKEGGKEITWQTGQGGEVSLPSGFPKDLPIYPKSQLITAVSQGAEEMNLVFTTDDSVAQVYASLKKELGGMGWTAVMENTAPDFHLLSAKKGNRGANLVVTGKSGEPTSISLTYQAQTD